MTSIVVLQVARTCHGVNKLWCEENGDRSQPTWDEAPEWQRGSVIDGVEFHLANADASASASHDSWMRRKVAEGWVYGDVKDPDAKTHPCIVPFDELPSDQQQKDYLFRAVVRSFVR